MKNVIVKALQKAQAKGLSANDTADLIVDYLEIAGEINQPQATVINQNIQEYIPYDTEYITSSVEADTTITEIKSKTEPLEAPVQVGKVLGKSSNGDVWTVESLAKALSNTEWAFDAEPENLPGTVFKYRGTVVQSPRGMEGVGVVFSCPDVKTPREIPVFFSLGDKNIDPQGVIADVKSSIEKQFSSLVKEVKNSTVALKSFPADIAGMGICAGEV